MDDSIKLAESIEVKESTDDYKQRKDSFMRKLLGARSKKFSAFVFYIHVKCNENIKYLNVRDFSYGSYNMTQRTLLNFCEFLEAEQFLTPRGNRLYLITDDLKKLLKESSDEINEIFQAQWGTLPHE